MQNMQNFCISNSHTSVFASSDTLRSKSPQKLKNQDTARILCPDFDASINNRTCILKSRKTMMV